MLFAPASSQQDDKQSPRMLSQDLREALPTAVFKINAD